jgi:hypothetical protein
MNGPQIAKTLWLPFAPSFRHALLDATTDAFVGQSALRTSFDETVRAEGPLTGALRKLREVGRPDVAQLILEFYPRLMPFYIGCGSKNPVHHTAYVIEFVTTILIGEGRTSVTELSIGILAALFHDVAQGRSKLAKITEAHLKTKIGEVIDGKATSKELQDYRDDAIKARQEHMREGARIAGDILRENEPQYPRLLTGETIREVQRLVEHHDDPKIPVTYAVIRRTFAEDDECRAWRAELPADQKAELTAWLGETGEQYLIGVDDWRLQILHEADLLWMVTQDGIDADLIRFSPAEAKTPRGIVDNNTGLHRQEMEQYRGRPDFSRYGFRNSTVYRSRTGYALFEYLVQVLDERYPASAAPRSLPTPASWSRMDSKAE